MKNIYGFILALALLYVPAKACKCSSYYEGVDSVQQLTPYTFVALAKITADIPVKQKPGEETPGTGILKINIIEQFKGDMADEFVETLPNSSCDMGFDEGEEWPRRQPHHIPGL